MSTNASKCLMATVFVISGCSTFPNQIAGPTINPPQNNSELKADYKLNDKSIIAGETSDWATGILPVETTPKGIKSQIMALRGAYRERNKKLLNEVDGLNMSQLAGIVISAIGVGIGDVTTRNAGAGIAGLSSFWSDHFQTMKQAINYKTAADALDCVYRDFDAIPQDLLQQAYSSNGMFIFSKDEFAKNTETDKAVAEGYETLSNLYIKLNDTVYAIDQKLRSLQASVTIAKVDVSDIQAAVTNKSKAQATADGATKKISSELKPALLENAGKAGRAASVAEAARQRSTQAEGYKQKMSSQIPEQQNIVENLKLKRNELTQSRLSSVNSAQESLQGTRNREIARDAQTIAEENKLIASFEKESRKLANYVELQKKAEDDATDARGKLFQAEADTKSIQEERNKLELLASLLKSGFFDKTLLLPANASTCLTAMGK